jgi:hypothetical protein
MKPQDWFGLGVRFAGVWCAIQAAINVAYFLDVRLGFSELRESAYGGVRGSPIGYLLYAAVYAVLAAYFVLGAGHLTRLSFGGSESDKEQVTEMTPSTEDDHTHVGDETGG